MGAGSRSIPLNREGKRTSGMVARPGRLGGCGAIAVVLCLCALLAAPNAIAVGAHLLGPVGSIAFEASVSGTPRSLDGGHEPSMSSANLALLPSRASSLPEVAVRQAAPAGPASRAGGAGPLAFRSQTYLVTFTEIGLPTGTEWYVNVTGTPYLTSTVTTATAELSNASYLYAVGTSDHAFYAHGGSFTVNGAPVSVTVDYGPAAKFPVTFNETGLPNGHVWYVNLSGGLSLVSSSGTVSTTLYNGSYTFNVTLLGGHWVPVPNVGFFEVAGTPITPATVQFVYSYAVTFDRPGGTPSGTSWSVALTGPNALLLTVGPELTTAQGSSGGSITFYEPNGSYTYLVLDGADTNYLGTGSFTIDGAGWSIAPSALPSGGLSPYLLYGVVAAAGIVVAAIVLLLIGRRRPKGPSPEAPSGPTAGPPGSGTTPPPAAPPEAR
jgi:hypothetical protein